MFEIYTMVSEIHDNVDLVLGVKTLRRRSEHERHNLLILEKGTSFFPVHKEMIKSKERRYVKVEAPFLDEI